MYIADCHAHAVFVVNATDKLCFKFPDPSSTRGAYNPRGVTSDSHAGELIVIESQMGSCWEKKFNLFSQVSFFFKIQVNYIVYHYYEFLSR